MQISEAGWSEYVKRLAQIDEKAGQLMQAWIDANGLEDLYAAARYAYSLVSVYGEAAAALACEMYDTAAEASGKVLPPAEPAPTATFEETATAVRGTVSNRHNSVPDTVSRLTKQAAADTTLQNARRDGAQFAWVPHGDTCAFCIMLASNGWQNVSKKALRNGHAEHIHAHCDCEYAVRFDDHTTIAGYDPDRYYDMYRNAEGSTWEEKVNSMRREQYARNKEYINGQKRAAYQERKDTDKSKSIDRGWKGAIIEEGYNPADIRKAISQSTTNFVNREINSPDSLYGEVCDLVQKLDGFYDVKMHGAPDRVKIFTSTVNADELARIILSRSDYNDEPIRLLSCETGKITNGTCVAMELSKLLGVDVMAPTEELLVSEGGAMKIESKKEKGWMRVFHPDGSYEDNI